MDTRRLEDLARRLAAQHEMLEVSHHRDDPFWSPEFRAAYRAERERLRSPTRARIRSRRWAHAPAPRENRERLSALGLTLEVWPSRWRGSWEWAVYRGAISVAAGRRSSPTDAKAAAIRWAEIRSDEETTR